MAIKKLIGDKERIVSQHLETLGKINNEILKLTSAATRDKKAGGRGRVGITGLFQALVGFNTDSSLEMDSRDRLEYARLWFQNAEAMRKTVANDPGYASLMKDIDAQLSLYRQALAQIDQEMRDAKDEGERKRLGKKKEGYTEAA